MSADLVWQIVRKQNSFLVKRGGHVFSSEPGNLKNRNTFKYSGLARPQTIGVTAGPEGKGVKITIAKKDSANKPAKKYSSTVIARAGTRRVAKTVLGLTNGGYRPELKQAALARVSAVLAAQKPRKAAKVGRK